MIKPNSGIKTNLGGGVITPGATVNLDSGNVASYPGSGTDWFDLTTNNYDAVLQNGVGFSASNGGILVFDGINDYVEGNAGYQLDSGGVPPFSIEVWFKQTATYTGFPHLFTVKGFSNAFVAALVPASQFAAYGTLTFGSRTDFLQIKITDTISLNTWYQVVIVFEGTDFLNIANYKLYLNNSSKSLATAGAYATIGNASFIGSESPSSQFITGNIPIFRLYEGDALDASEVADNFNAVKSRYGL